MEITNICNKSCSFCPGTNRAGKSLSKDEFDIITSKLVGLTDYVYLHVMGEPLLHKDIGELIRIARGKGLKVAVTTNGTLLSKKGDELIAAGVYKVNISVHSLEGAGIAEREEYLSAICDFADKASGAGVLCVLRLWNRGCDEDLNLATEDYLHTRFPTEWRIGARGARLRDKLHIEYGDRFIWPDIEREDEASQVFCYGLKDHFGILSDGTVIPCCLDRDGVIALGSAFTDDLAAVLSTPRALAIRDGFKCRRAVEPLCRRCPYARRF